MGEKGGPLKTTDDEVFPLNELFFLPLNTDIRPYFSNFLLPGTYFHRTPVRNSPNSISCVLLLQRGMALITIGGIAAPALLTVSPL